MAEDPLRVTVAWSPAPRKVKEYEVSLPLGACVGDAIRACGIAAEVPAATLGTLSIGVWGRKAAMDRPLKDRDRVELCRPLVVDPKVARRERFRRQGSRAAGLFARPK